MWPQSGESFRPNSGLYGVPAVLQTTSVPSPMSQVMSRTFAVAVTVMPPAEALAVIGPTVWAFGSLRPHPDRHADQADAVRTRLGRDADVDGRQMHLLDRDLRHLARRRSRAGVRRRVLRPDGDEQTRLRLVAVVDRAVAGLVTLPARVARRRLGLDRTDVAVVAVRPVARGRDEQGTGPGGGFVMPWLVPSQ